MKPLRPTARSDPGDENTTSRAGLSGRVDEGRKMDRWAVARRLQEEAEGLNALAWQIIRDASGTDAETAAYIEWKAKGVRSIADGVREETSADRPAR